jgi:hypothetical protein
MDNANYIDNQIAADIPKSASELPYEQNHNYETPISILSKPRRRILMAKIMGNKDDTNK